LNLKNQQLTSVHHVFSFNLANNSSLNKTWNRLKSKNPKTYLAPGPGVGKRISCCRLRRPPRHQHRILLQNTSEVRGSWIREGLENENRYQRRRRDCLPCFGLSEASISTPAETEAERIEGSRLLVITHSRSSSRSKRRGVSEWPSTEEWVIVEASTEGGEEGTRGGN